MSLGSVSQIALSGISAAQLVVDVVGNNLANARTVGFKASEASFSTQSMQTGSLGSAPTTANGGTNPVQTGLGVQAAGISPRFTQGSIAMNADPLSLALQGDGFFILEDDRQGQLFTRDGRFQLNADKELVSASGHRVLGFRSDEDFQIQTGELTSLTVPLGRQIEGADGSVATLTDFSITEDGRLSGRFSDGYSRDLGQIRIAQFANPSGLQQTGNTLYAATPSSGLPLESDPGGSNGSSLVGGAVELSNTDVGQSLIDLSEASTLFRASVRVLETSEAMFDTLLTLTRPR